MTHETYLIRFDLKVSIFELPVRYLVVRVQNLLCVFTIANLTMPTILWVYAL